MLQQAQEPCPTHQVWTQKAAGTSVSSPADVGAGVMPADEEGAGLAPADEGGGVVLAPAGGLEVAPAIDRGGAVAALAAGPSKSCQREQVHAWRCNPGTWQGFAERRHTNAQETQPLSIGKVPPGVASWLTSYVTRPCLSPGPLVGLTWRALQRRWCAVFGGALCGLLSQEQPDGVSLCLPLLLSLSPAQVLRSTDYRVAPRSHGASQGRRRGCCP